MTQWSGIEFDGQGNPVLVDYEPLYLANAKLNKTTSNVSGVQRSAAAGNPWFDPNSGRFANGPVGVQVRAGAELMKDLINSAKVFISETAARIGADSISASLGKEGHIVITLFKSGEAVASFNAATKNADPTNINTGGDFQEFDNSTPMSTLPQGVEPGEWSRRLDAVRDAAREFDPQNIEDIKEWLIGRTKRELDDKEVQSFFEDVKRQRLSDLVDVLDHAIRRRVESKVRGRRVVTVKPPRGWLRRTMANLDDNDIAELHRRLSARGFEDKDLQTHLINRFPERRREALIALIGEEEQAPRKTIKNAKPKSSSSSNNSGTGS